MGNNPHLEGHRQLVTPSNNPHLEGHRQVVTTSNNPHLEGHRQLVTTSNNPHLEGHRQVVTTSNNPHLEGLVTPSNCSSSRHPQAIRPGRLATHLQVSAEEETEHNMLLLISYVTSYNTVTSASSFRNRLTIWLS